MNTRNQAYWRRRAWLARVQPLLARLSIIPTAMLSVMIGALAVIGVQQTSLGSWMNDAPAQTRALDPLPTTRMFALCAGRVRTTCVVDGDTFWLDGVKIRIADINTPEIGSPECAAEAALGRRASTSLAELLGEAPFTLASIDRDEDQYGRKLRIAERNGQSIGALLVAEGLAHEWRGRREGWC